MVYSLKVALHALKLRSMHMHVTIKLISLYLSLAKPFSILLHSFSNLLEHARFIKHTLCFCFAVSYNFVENDWRSDIVANLHIVLNYKEKKLTKHLSHLWYSSRGYIYFDLCCHINDNVCIFSSSCSLVCTP